MPYSSPSSTSFPRFTSESCSYGAPTKIESASAVAFSLIASFTDVVIFSFERSFPMILAPPDTLRTTGIGYFSSTDVLKTPRVNIKESA